MLRPLSVIVLLVSTTSALSRSRNAFCHQPSFTSRLPQHLRTRISGIWKDYRTGTDCQMHVARTRNMLATLTPNERARLLPPGTRHCQLPAVVANLPHRAQKRIIDIWKRRDPKGDCKEQQRKTRLILLNLPAHLRAAVRPTPFQCALPHFVLRLEPAVQSELQKIWMGYERGTPCNDRVDQQLEVLQKHDIALGSFATPPADALARAERYRKLRKASKA